MENAVAVKEQELISLQDVKRYIAPNATDKELFMFMGIAKSYNLNPLKREIHFIKYGNAAASIVVGYEIYLKRAERTGKLDGWKCWIEKDDIGGKAIIEIKRKDQSLPIKWEVYRKEFDKGQSTWKSMPTFMLKKVAIAQGFRLAFPDDLGGLPYLPEELPQTSHSTSEDLNRDVVYVTPEPAPEPQDVPEKVETTLAEDQVIVKITGVKSKTGETNGKKWTAYFIQTATGEYGTFSETLADVARTYAESGELVPLTWKPGKKEGKKEVVSIGG